MVGRFLKIKTAVRKALIDIKSNISFSNDEINILDEIYSTLHPIKTAVEVLSLRDMTLLTAEATLRFWLRKLKELKSPLATQFVNRLRERIIERRTDLFGIHQYLHNPVAIDETDADNDDEAVIFSIPDRPTIRRILKELIERLYPIEQSESVTLSLDENAGIDELVEGTKDADAEKPIDMKEQFKSAIQKKMDSVMPRSTTYNLNSILMKEMSLFENGGIRGKFLELAYQALLTIPPTSIEAERAFSSAGNVCTSLRTSLNDNTLDSICFLRGHFLSVSK